VNHIEDVISRGDVLDVLVQEVDKARGRIGLKLIQKHEDGKLVSPEELVERAKNAPPREPREDRGPRRDDRRGGRGGGGGRGGPRRDREEARSE
jgi:polyribonucleotide nucleotidyltransferase